MAYTSTTWVDRAVSRPRTYTVTNNSDGSITLTPSEGTIYQAGTPITAAEMTNIENELVFLDTSIIGSQLYLYKNMGGTM